MIPERGSGHKRVPSEGRLEFSLFSRFLKRSGTSRSEVALHEVGILGEVALKAILDVGWRLEFVVFAGVDDVLGGAADARNSASCDETGRILFFFFIHLSFAFRRHSSQLLLHFYDSSGFTNKVRFPFTTRRRHFVAFRSFPSSTCYYSRYMR